MCEEEGVKLSSDLDELHFKEMCPRHVVSYFPLRKANVPGRYLHMVDLLFNSLSRTPR